MIFSGFLKVFSGFGVVLTSLAYSPPFLWGDVIL